MKKTYRIAGMHCVSCVSKITEIFKKSIRSVEVTLNPPNIILKDQIIPDFTELNRMISEAGDYSLHEEDNVNPESSWVKTYYPLLLIISLISIASFASVSTLHGWMLHFMAGFFIVFSFFKLLDLNGFKDAYASYDLLAQRWNAYGYIYPFLELGLGFLFLFQFYIHFALYFSIVLMGFSSLGVIQALMKKQKIRCACLGTALNLPMSTITLVEDLGMVVMAVIMLSN